MFTTLGGVGPAPAREWLDGLFAASYAAELLDGGTGSRTAPRSGGGVGRGARGGGGRPAAWASPGCALFALKEGRGDGEVVGGGGGMETGRRKQLSMFDGKFD